MFCQKCGARIPEGAEKCPGCGALRDGLKYCQHCGQQIDKECIVCPKCGKQVGEAKSGQSGVVINNTNQNQNNNAVIGAGFGRLRNKWVALVLCILLGEFGAHKFYEGRIGMGILYLFTFGLFGIGWIVDIISLAFKPNPYVVPY